MGNKKIPEIIFPGIFLFILFYKLFYSGANAFGDKLANTLLVLVGSEGLTFEREGRFGGVGGFGGLGGAAQDVKLSRKTPIAR